MGGDDGSDGGGDNDCPGGHAVGPAALAEAPAIGGTHAASSSSSAGPTADGDGPRGGLAANDDAPSAHVLRVRQLGAVASFWAMRFCCTTCGKLWKNASSLAVAYAIRYTAIERDHGLKLALHVVFAVACLLGLALVYAANCMVGQGLTTDEYLHILHV